MSYTRRKYKLMENKYKMKDALTGKSLNMNDEVIKTKNALDWVKKQGFLVVRPTLIREVTMVIIFFLAIFMLISFSSAITLIDSSNHDSIKNILTASSNNMNFIIYPDNIKIINARNITQYINFSWTGQNPQDISWILRYSDQLRSGVLQIYQNASRNYISRELVDFMAINYPVNNVNYSLNLGTPDSRCQVGSINNTQMYLVTIPNPFNQSQKVNVTYCFTNITSVNSTSYLISGNYKDWKDTIKTHFIFDWDNVVINYLGTGILGIGDTGNYYQILDTTLTPNKIYSARIIYTPFNESKSGKWSILGYDGNQNVINAINNNAYIYSDPSWTTADCGGIGGSVTIDGDYCVNTFTSNGTFIVNVTSLNVSVLVVAGGGGGAGSGGGAGGLIYNLSYNVTGNISVIVGVGGKGNLSDTTANVAFNGTNSSFGVLQARGGGAGSPNGVGGRNGGSGGGGGFGGGATFGGNGTLNQGTNGGYNTQTSSPYPSGGGGGSSTAGLNGTSNTGGNGGNGTQISINGTAVYYAGGGGGACYQTCTVGIGGLGGGGNAGNLQSGSNGTNGLGGGGGGASQSPTIYSGGNGGSGIVIIRYLAGLGNEVENGTGFNEIQVPDNETYLLNTNYSFSVDVNNSNGSVLAEINGINYTMRNLTPSDNDDYDVSIGGLTAGSNSVKFITWSQTLPKRINSTLVNFTILRATPNLSISGLGDFVNGSLINISLINCPAQLSCSLYRNGTLVNNPDNSSLPIGIYNYTGNTTENVNYTSYSTSGILNIVAPIQVNVVFSFFTFDFTSLSNVIIFLIAIIIAVLILIFVHWEFGCLCIMIEGFILLINLSNKFIGLMLILVSFILIFMSKGSGK